MDFDDIADAADVLRDQRREQGDCTACGMPIGYHVFGCPNIPVRR